MNMFYVDQLMYLELHTLIELHCLLGLIELVARYFFVKYKCTLLAFFHVPDCGVTGPGARQGVFYVLGVVS